MTVDHCATCDDSLHWQIEEIANSTWRRKFPDGHVERYCDSVCRRVRVIDLAIDRLCVALALGSLPAAIASNTPVGSAPRQEDVEMMQRAVRFAKMAGGGA
jgi:hypothetical protein